jgi:hypothetical protein
VHDTNSTCLKGTTELDWNQQGQQPGGRRYMATIDNGTQPAPDVTIASEGVSTVNPQEWQVVIATGEPPAEPQADATAYAVCVSS